MIKLDDALTGTTKIGFDTAPIIYFIEAHPLYDRLVTELFQRIADGRFEGITSVISLSEVLIRPLRQSSARLQQEYRDLLIHSFNFHTQPIDINIAEAGAVLRARYNIRTPDALQIATALSANCEAFITNDAALQRVTELRVLLLDELEL